MFGEAGITFNAGFNDAELESGSFLEGDKADDGGGDIEAEEPAVAVRKNGFEGAADDFEGGESDLVKGEPLAEEASIGKAVANGLEMFAGVEEANAVLGGVEKVCDDDVVEVGASANETAAVSDVGGEIG